VELRSTTPADITLPTLPMKPGQRVEVVYTNPADGRDLQLAYAINGKTVLLASNNTLNAAWPEPNLTDTLLVRARGVLAGGTGPVMQVLVDGVLVGSAEVKSTENADYRFAVPPMTAGRKLDIAYVNDAVVKVSTATSPSPTPPQATRSGCPAPRATATTSATARPPSTASMSSPPAAT